MRPSPLEKTARNAVSIYVQSIIMNSSDRQLQSCEVFGSGENGTSLATSDIDIRLYPRGFETWYIPPPEAVRNGQYQELRRLRNKFMRNGAFDGVELLNARYPLITMRHKNSNIRVQVVQSNSTTLQRRLIEEYIVEYPHLLPIYTAVKAMLGIRKLTEVFLGGLGSYPLLMMVVASLKLHPAADLATGFLNFLEFYAHFDSKTKALGLIPPGVHPKVLEEEDIPHITVTDRELRVSYSCNPLLN
jgi:non-canonical poly(A) RNA polymerase PAPD5/7